MEKGTKMIVGSILMTIGGMVFAGGKAKFSEPAGAAMVIIGGIVNISTLKK